MAQGGGTPGGRNFQAMLDGIFTPAYQELLWTENMDGRFPIFTADGEGRTCFLDMERGSEVWSMAGPMCRTPMSW